MNLNSGDFFFFFLVTWLILKLMRDQWRAALLVFSYAFYASWNWEFLPLLLMVTGVDHFAARRISAIDPSRSRRGYLFLSLFVNLGLLVYFKYAFHLANALAGWTGSPMRWSVPLIPIGLSFHTFQSMGYVLDVYRRKSEPEYSLLNYANFVSFFPQLIAGPIERSNHLMPQLSRAGSLRVSGGQAYRGFYLILLGLTMTLALGEVIAPYGLSVHDSIQPNALSTAHAPALTDVLLSFYVFPFTLYLRFAGYSFLAMGFALLLGVELSVNFKFPFFSRSMAEFWGRWHISLSKWIRDYIFFPLTGKVHSDAGLYALIFLTMLIFGIWHQASLGWIAAAVILAGYSIGGHIFFKGPARGGKLKNFCKALLTFHVFAVAMFFVNNLGLGQSLAEFIGALARLGELPLWTTGEWFYVRVLTALGVAVLIDAINFTHNDVLGVLRLRMPLRMTMVAFLILFLFFNRAPETGLSMYFRM